MKLSVLIKRQFSRLFDFIEEGTFIIMLTMWAAGYFASFAVSSMEVMNKFSAILGMVLSMASFAVGYILYKSEREKKREEMQKASVR